ncbi:MAG: hypothetical protein AABZ53_04110 [Planctomycetota bacterium]
MIFTGNAEATIDAKGRLSIPAKFRAQADSDGAGSVWVCIPWSGGVLRIYTGKQFERLAEMGQTSLTPDPDLAELETTFFSLAETLETDTAGRISMPKSLVELTGLGQECVVLGAKDRLEVRDRAKWKQTLPEQFNKLEVLAAKLAARGKA